MTRIQYTLFLILIIGSPTAQALEQPASSIASLEYKLSTQAAQQSDIEQVNAALAAHPNDPFANLAAGEVLSSLGLLELAQEAYARADKLRPGFVLSKFEEYMRLNDRRLKLIYPYVEMANPDAPSVKFRNALIWSERSGKREIAYARMKDAATVAKPWPGARSRYGMLEYNSGKLENAIKFCDAELKDNPHDLMAQKVRIMSLIRQSKKPTELKSDLQNVLRQNPNDEQMNLILGRALLYNKDYQNALWIALRGLLYSTAPSTLTESRNQLHELLKLLGPRPFVEVTDALCRALPADDFRATLFRMRVGELLVADGYSEHAQYQFKRALGMNAFFREPIAYKLGRECLKKCRLAEAEALFALAAKGNPNETKYRDAMIRTRKLLLNYGNDYALQVKTLVTAQK